MDVLRERIRDIFANSWKTITQGGQAAQSSQVSQNDLRAVFREFDVDGDGCVDEEELKSCIKRLDNSICDEEIKRMFSQADANSDGKITFEEFANISSVNPLTLAYKQVFKEFDVDDDGEITQDELVNVFVKMGQQIDNAEIDQIFREADTDHDGKINFDGIQ